MNIKKAAMMLTIMLITILSASSFYILTGEAELSKNIVVNSTQTEDGIVKGKDYEKVYDNEGPYTDSNGSYYIRYTGYTSHKTVIDLDNADKTDDDGKPSGGYDVTKEDDGSITILKTKITNTYKMFSKREGGTNTEIERVFVPSSIAFPTKDASGVPTQEGRDEGIASNTFSGYEDSTVEKDVIYHTGQLITSSTDTYTKYTGSSVTNEYDRTTKINKNTYSHITTYVYLGSENVLRDENAATFSIVGYAYGYHGLVENVFVSNSLDYPTEFFSICQSSTKSIKYALLDSGETWYENSRGLSTLFYAQTNLKLTSNFKLPDKIYQGNNSGKFNEWGLYCLFWGCTSLTDLPPNFEIPEGITMVSGVFYNCINLRGTIKMPDSIDIMFYNNTYYFLQYAGSNAKNLYGYNTPIVMKYNQANTKLKDYIVNVLTTTQSGYVTKVPYSNQTNWKKVVDNDNGTNSDDNGENKYYFQYTGNETVVDLNDTTVYPQTSDGCPSIQSTRVYNTYKMFANKTQLERVFIPSGIAIHAYGLTKYDSGIAENTFEGTTQEIDCIYHTGASPSNYYGAGLNANFDKTHIFDDYNTENNANVIPYLYLGNENYYSGYNSSWGQNQYAYCGAVPNVYVSKEVTDVRYLFSRHGYADDRFTRQQNPTEMRKILFDNEGTWTDYTWEFVNQEKLELSEKFAFPNPDGIITFDAVFHSTYIDHLPKAFVFPQNALTVLDPFCNCAKLSAIIKIGSNVTNISVPFYNAGTSATHIYTEFGTPIVVVADKTKSVYNTIANSIQGNKYVTLVDVNDSRLQSSYENNNPISIVEESTSKIVIEDCTEEVSVRVNKVESNIEKIMIEDETEYVSVAVNKKGKEEEPRE